MSLLLLHVKTLWNDYFPGTSPTNLPSQTYTTRPTPSGTIVYVLNCLFNSITSSGHDGALFCSSSVTHLLVESTSFFSCNTSGNGGAIHFSNSGQCVLHEVCGNNCCSTISNSVGQFAYVSVKYDISCKNYVNYSSISQCVNTQSSAWHTLSLGNGKICCPSVNISMNKNYGRSAIYCWPLEDSNYVTCSFTYSSFADNIATYSICILLNTGGAKYEIERCNILRNTQPIGNVQGTVYTGGILTIDDSCILENKATNIFFQESSYTITLSNCTVDLTSNNGYFTIKNTVTKNFILVLNHMSTQNCHSEYDSAGTLTPIIQTPSSSEKQIICYAGKEFLLHIPLRDFVTLISILIFNFIYPYASSNSFY
jgi:hypothetical protein